MVTLKTIDWSKIISGHSLVFRVTIPDAVLMQFDLLMMNTTLLETCKGQ